MGYCLVHGGSADHASEERIRGLCCMLPERPEIYCTALEEDWRYGLGSVGALTKPYRQDGQALHRFALSDSPRFWWQYHRYDHQSRTSSADGYGA